MEMQDAELDSDIITNVALVIMRDPDGMNTLVDAATNTPDPAKGAAQYLMMLFDAVNNLLEQTGIPFDFGVVTAKGGVVDNLSKEVIRTLTEAGVETGPGFDKSLIGFFLEMVKAASQAEEQGGSQPALPGPSTTAGAGGLLDQVSLGGAPV